MNDYSKIIKNKESYQKDSALMEDILENARLDEKDKAQANLHWREGRLDKPEELADFNRSNIMKGPHGQQKEVTEMPADMANRNEKTKKMYQRYFDAKKTNSVETDKALSLWVKNGDKKAEEITRQTNENQKPASLPIGFLHHHHGR